jgi:hypothetical protein
MLTLKTSVATAIVAGAVAATAGITYVTTKTAVAVNCPSPSVAASSPSPPSALPPGDPVQPYHGKQW